MTVNIPKIVKRTTTRIGFWIDFIDTAKFKNIAEVGVYRGDWAKAILENCSKVEGYGMIDPWRSLSNWNKPFNLNDNSKFEAFYQETLTKTDFAKEKRRIYRGKTTEVIDDIPDESLDFVYIDGDHTLKGITIDLVNLWGKVKPNGFIGGDDFASSMWQHYEEFEPTLIFPFAVYFAEAMRTKIYGLPNSQFLISKSQDGFEFIDLTEGEYLNTSILHQLKQPKMKEPLTTYLIRKYPKIYSIYKTILGR